MYGRPSYSNDRCASAEPSQADRRQVLMRYRAVKLSQSVSPQRNLSGSNDLLAENQRLTEMVSQLQAALLQYRRRTCDLEALVQSPQDRSLREKVLPSRRAMMEAASQTQHPTSRTPPPAKPTATEAPNEVLAQAGRKPTPPVAAAAASRAQVLSQFCEGDDFLEQLDADDVLYMVRQGRVKSLERFLLQRIQALGDVKQQLAEVTMQYEDVSRRLATTQERERLLREENAALAQRADRAENSAEANETSGQHKQHSELEQLKLEFQLLEGTAFQHQQEITHLKTSLTMRDGDVQALNHRLAVETLVSQERQARCALLTSEYFESRDPMLKLFHRTKRVSFANKRMKAADEMEL